MEDTPTPNSHNPNPTKSICFRVQGIGGVLKWFTINPSSNSESDSYYNNNKTLHHCKKPEHPRPKSFEKLNLHRPVATLEDHSLFSSFVTLGSSLYSIGGFLRPLSESHMSAKKGALKFDTACIRDGWKTFDSMSTVRNSPHAMVLNGKIYLLNGLIEREPIVWAEVFDPEEGTWANLPNPPIAKGFGCELIYATIEDEEKILVGYRHQLSGKSVTSFAYDAQTNSWDFCNDNIWMDHASAGRQAIMVDRTLYWYDYDQMTAYDLDQKIWYFGNLERLKGAEVLLYHPELPVDRPWLLHVDGKRFCVVSIDGGLHTVSGIAYTCIFSGNIQVSKCMKSINGKGKLKITLDYIKSYFLEGNLSLRCQPCMMDGIFKKEDNSEEGSASGQMVGDSALKEASFEIVPDH